MRAVSVDLREEEEGGEERRERVRDEPVEQRSRILPRSSVASHHRSTRRSDLLVFVLHLFISMPLLLIFLVLDLTSPFSFLLVNQHECPDSSLGITRTPRRPRPPKTEVFC